MRKHANERICSASVLFGVAVALFLRKKFHFVSQAFEKPVHPPMFVLMDGVQILLHPHFKQASQSVPVELPLLDEPAEHLGLHEDLEEATHGLGGDRFAKALPLEGAGDRGGGRGGVAVLPLAGEEERIVADQLHEKADEGLGHDRAELFRVTRCVSSLTGELSSPLENVLQR